MSRVAPEFLGNPMPTTLLLSLPQRLSESAALPAGGGHLGREGRRKVYRTPLLSPLFELNFNTPQRSNSGTTTRAAPADASPGSSRGG
jgi:hypothetical protein